MGRLVNKKRLKSLFLPALIALGLFFVARPTLAQLTEEPPTALTELQVGVESVNDYSHIFYINGGEKKFVTQGSQNSRHPDANGEYMAWITDLNGIGQVYRYHVPSGSLMQILGAKNNQKPRVSTDGKVVWEGWVESEGKGTWQVFLFDNVKVEQLTNAPVATNPDVEGDFVIFSSKDDEDIWKAEGYSIVEKKTAVIKVGEEAKFPSLRGEEVVLKVPGKAEQVEPLKIQDLLLLDHSLVPEVNSLEEVPEVTLDDIREELGEEFILPENQ